MECACLPNTGPMMTSEPHMIPGYAGFVPQFKFKFGNTFGIQTNRTFLDPCINMSPRTVLSDICPNDCGGGGFLQHASGCERKCGCVDIYSCRPNKNDQFFGQCNPGFQNKSPQFQTILNHSYAPWTKRPGLRTYDQDEYRDSAFAEEKDALDGWRFCYKTKPWDRPERLQPWDGDHAEFRRTQTTLLPPLMKDDLDIHLHGTPCFPTLGKTYCVC